MSSTHAPAAGNCDVTMINCSRVVSIDALSQWRWDQWFKEFVKSRKLFGKWRHNQLAKGNEHDMNNGFDHIAVTGQHDNYVRF